ncbi:MAG TPA: hypothetical protein VGR37_10610, partial [Longimicrobiaceae bacterium]|nr:hypothetical protein [Longimicrobiaceae bacterium]
MTAPQGEGTSGGTGAAGDRLARWAAHPLGPVLLFLSAVAEACLFPAPTEAVYVALAVGRPRRSPRLALLAA